MSEYKFIIIPILSVIVAQIIKTIIETIINKRFDVRRLFNGSGGMPSSHSTLVVSLVTIIGLNYGISSIYFAISLILSLVVLYDAMGIRYETGKQAEIINKISKQIKFKEFISLKEKIGHKPIEVLGGIITGIVMAIILNNII